MSKAQLFALKGIQGGLVSSMALTAMLYAFSCIGADLTWSALVASVAVGAIPLVATIVFFMCVTLIKVLFQRLA